MTRRPLFLIAAIAATLAIVIGACSNPPAAPALTDPKEILAKTAESFKDITTVEIVGSLTGSIQMAELGGELDLSSTTIAGALDVPNQKGKIVIDAPALLGTKLEALVVDGAAYVKVTGPLAGFLGLEGGKYMKQEITPEASGEPVTDPSQIAGEVDKAQEQLDKLPTPEKLADEKCGDVDCYHIRMNLTADDLKDLSPEAGAVGEGTATIDLWTQKTDLRPAKLEVSVTSPETGTIGATFTFKYGGTVDVSAPPADQVVEQ